ncbi:MAG: hypothetical protein JSV27_09045 [Candidatus Bathyarchaeota archaeon]|nr:MAG: hypothetical protein JSV27_09045 [Candidatus Bathyarchaeota archaeon]
MPRTKHAFSVEMRSREHVKRVSVSDKSRDPVIFEGELGELNELRIIEGVMLEVDCANGVLRIDMTKEEYERARKAGSNSGRGESTNEGREVSG